MSRTAATAAAGKGSRNPSQQNKHQASSDPDTPRSQLSPQKRKGQQEEWQQNESRARTRLS
jgi:hypothetical protein